MDDDEAAVFLAGEREVEAKLGAFVTGALAGGEVVWSAGGVYGKRARSS